MTIREALEEVITSIEVRFPVIEYAIDKKPYLDAEKVLSKPPRNCDKYEEELDAQIAFLNDVWLISVDKETLLERDKFENWTDEMRSDYARWLMAPVTDGGEA